MNAKEFKELTGCEPENDDLDRVNCPKAGEQGHKQCGICPDCGQPRFCCVCPLVQIEKKVSGLEKYLTNQIKLQEEIIEAATKQINHMNDLLNEAKK